MGRFLYSQRTHDFSRPARPDLLERIRSERLSLGDKSVLGHCDQCHQWSVRRVWQRKSHSHRTGLLVDREQRPWHRQYESAQHELPWQLHAKLRAKCRYFCVTYLHSRQGIHLQGLVWRMHGYSIDLYRVDDCLSLGDSDLRTFKGRKAIAVLLSLYPLQDRRPHPSNRRPLPRRNRERGRRFIFIRPAATQRHEVPSISPVFFLEQTTCRQ